MKKSQLLLYTTIQGNKVTNHLKVSFESIIVVQLYLLKMKTLKNGLLRIGTMKILHRALL